jgi:hypothetical protein
VFCVVSLREAGKIRRLSYNSQGSWLQATGSNSGLFKQKRILSKESWETHKITRRTGEWFGKQAKQRKLYSSQDQGQSQVNRCPPQNALAYATTSEHGYGPCSPRKRNAIAMASGTLHQNEPLRSSHHFITSSQVFDGGI